MQENTARESEVFHGFAFRDRIGESGITFTHRVVEDASIHNKAAHYDHGNGLAFADVDSDGLPDIHFTTQIGSNQFWRSRGDGAFENITGNQGLALSDAISVAASFGDIDNDGDPDLLVTTVRQGDHLFENRGRGHFTDITAASGPGSRGHSPGAAFLDFDRDGLLDIFITRVGRYTSRERGTGGCHRALPDAFAGHLFLERAEAQPALPQSGQPALRGNGRAARPGRSDPDRGGYPDLYLVNMQGDDHLSNRHRWTKSGPRQVSGLGLHRSVQTAASLEARAADGRSVSWTDRGKCPASV